MPEVDELRTKARVGEILNRWPTVGLAVGVVRNGSLEYFHGHGLADIASNTPVTDGTVFRIGSITKTFTAIAVMQLWEQGLVDLDAPANDYLRAYTLIASRCRGIRARMLRALLHIRTLRRSWTRSHTTLKGSGHDNDVDSRRVPLRQGGRTWIPVVAHARRAGGRSHHAAAVAAVCRPVHADLLRPSLQRTVGGP